MVFSQAFSTGWKARLQFSATPQLNNLEDIGWLSFGGRANRLENLQAIPREVHAVVTAEPGKLLKSLGRQPTPAEIEHFRQKMDRLIEPYTLRRGLPRPPPRFPKPPKVKP